QDANRHDQRADRWLLAALCANAGLGRGERPLSEFSPADRLDDFRRHAEIEPALVLAKGDVHDPIAIARHGRELGVTPVPRRVEQHHEEVRNRPGTSGQIVEWRDVLNARAVGRRYPHIRPRIFLYIGFGRPRAKTSIRMLRADLHLLRWHEIDAECRTLRDRRIEEMDREVAS